MIQTPKMLWHTSRNGAFNDESTWGVLNDEMETGTPSSRKGSTLSTSIKKRELVRPLLPLQHLDHREQQSNRERSSSDQKGVPSVSYGGFLHSLPSFFLSLCLVHNSHGAEDLDLIFKTMTSTLMEEGLLAWRVVWLHGRSLIVGT